MSLQAFTKDGAPRDGIQLHPRAYVELTTVVGDETVSTGLTPHRVSLMRGSHNRATEVSVRIDGSVLPFPIRLVGGSFVDIYMGVADTADAEIKTEANRRFCGYFDDLEQNVGDRIVEFKAQDLSRVLREHKPLIPKQFDDGRIVDPTPRYSDTLEHAIRRIMSVVPGFESDEDDAPLALRQTDALQNANLGRLVAGMAKNGPIALKPDWNAWQTIEHVCGLVACHVHVDLREIVVRTADEVFDGKSTKVYFIYGSENANAFGPSFHKKFIRNRKGVRVVAWDPERHQTVEAVYPSDSVMRKSYPRKRPPPKKIQPQKTSHKKAVKPPKDPDRDVYELDPAHYTDEALQDKAKAIWLERSRQECDGKISTPILTEEVLGLQNGDRFAIKIQPDIDAEIERIGDDVLAARFLQERLGISLEAADVLLAARKKPTSDLWYAKTVTLEIPSEQPVTVGFINLVEI